MKVFALSDIVISKGESMERRCKWCQELFDLSDRPKGWMANHSRWCIKNPNREDYVESLKKRESSKIMSESKKKTGYTNQFSKAKIQGRILESSLKGKPNPKAKKFHSEETKKLMSEKALKSKHRRLRKGIIEYKGVKLDSSWELELAKRLDELSIEWIRPESLQWVDLQGKVHNYFPDFYLPRYNIYLDPKNPAAYSNQVEKINILKKTYPNIVFIRTLEECKTFDVIN